MALPVMTFSPIAYLLNEAIVPGATTGTFQARTARVGPARSEPIPAATRSTEVPGAKREQRHNAANRTARSTAMCPYGRQRPRPVAH